MVLKEGLKGKPGFSFRSSAPVVNWLLWADPLGLAGLIGDYGLALVGLRI